MNDTATPRDCFTQGLRLMRSGDARGAIPLLEMAVKDAGLRYAPSVLRVAKAFVSGQQTTIVNFENQTFVFALNPHNLGLDIHHMDGRFFETEELSYCKSIVPKRSVIVDIGANTGNHLIFFGGLLDPRLLIPVEPVPQAVETLKKNLSLNKLVVDERGLGLAAGSEEGTLSLNFEAGTDLVVASVTDKISDGVEPSIKAVRIDDLIKEKIDFIKLDVEGFEKHVLAGAKRILSDDKPLLMVEMHDKNRSELMHILESYGYKSIKEFPGMGYKNVFCRVQ